MEHLDLDGEPTTDRRSETSKANARFAGIAKGTQLASKRTYDADKLAAQFADRLLAGGALPRNRARPPTEDDKAMLVRVTGVSVEEFQGKFLQRLMTVADKAVDRIEEKLDEGGQKLGDLNMTLAVAVDKMAAISGRTAQSGNVSVTVNNYGQMSRAEMLAEVAKDAKPAIEI